MGRDYVTDWPNCKQLCLKTFGNGGEAGLGAKTDVGLVVESICAWGSLNLEAERYCSNSSEHSRISSCFCEDVPIGDDPVDRHCYMCVCVTTPKGNTL